MKSSTWFKIGLTGMVVAVLAALAPVVLAVLGVPEISERIGSILNEKSLSVILVIFCFIVYSGIKKKREEAIIESIKSIPKNSSDQTSPEVKHPES